jgi:hypothetical protein
VRESSIQDWGSRSLTLKGYPDPDPTSHPNSSLTKVDAAQTCTRLKSHPIGTFKSLHLCPTTNRSVLDNMLVVEDSATVPM